MLTRLSSRRRLAREERGQGLVEFALILPVFLFILVGIIEFGSVYSHVISMRQGVREAGRQGSVGKFTNGNCPVLGVPDADKNRDALICVVKDQAGAGSVIKAHVQFDTTYTAGNGLVICAVYPLQSLTGLFQPFLNGRTAKTKAEFRLENIPALPVPALSSGGDVDPTGQNWTWCS